MEEDISASAAAGDQNRRLSETIALEHTRLQQFIRSRVPDVGEAEDILQEVFYELVAAYRLMKPIDASLPPCAAMRSGFHSVPNFGFEDGATVGDLMQEGRGILLDFAGTGSLKTLASKCSGQLKYISDRAKEQLG